MPGIALSPGEQGLLLESAAHVLGTTNTDDYWLVRGGGGIVTLDITDINGGSVDSVTVQAKNGANYDDIFSFAALGIVANGRYRFRVAAGAVGAAQWPYAVEDVLPPVGRVKIISSVATITFQVTLEVLVF